MRASCNTIDLVLLGSSSPPKPSYFLGVRVIRRQHHALVFLRPLRGLDLWGSHAGLRFAAPMGYDPAPLRG